MAYAKNKKRLSIDFSNEVYKDLEDYIKNSNGLTKGFLIEEIIKNFVSLNKEICEELNLFCYKQYRKHAKISFNLPDDDVAKQEYELEMAKKYEQLALMYNRFSSYQKTDVSGIVNMVRFEMKNAFAIIPANWIPINPEKAKDSENLIVLEVHNKGNLDIPHYCYFIFGNELTFTDEQIFLESIRNRCPDFKKAEENKFIPKYGVENENGYRKVLNEDEYLKKTDIGLFKVPDEENSRKNYPYDATITRK